MRNTQRAKAVNVYGDFQTPKSLAAEICELLTRKGTRPSSIVESSCGTGSLLLAALDQFPWVIEAVGMDINPNYIQKLQLELASKTSLCDAVVSQGDFFRTDWSRILRALPKPILIIGNPPWVTNTKMGAIGGQNLPPKSNFQNLSGFDAKTGKSNFDISEWMLIKLLQAAQDNDTVFAIVCKTAVARKTLLYAWKYELRLDQAEMYLIDAQKHFGVSVDACVLYCQTGLFAASTTCKMYEGFQSAATAAFGYINNHLVSNIEKYEQWRFLEAERQVGWRSGVKHDCSNVMELTEEDGRYRNGLGETYELESTFLYPMLKSSDIGNGDSSRPRRLMVIPQRQIGEATDHIAVEAPKTWTYLNDHRRLLDSRKSSLYRNRPQFSIFGVGAYSFAPWKVAISGLYKRLRFQVVGPHRGRPVVLDDTCYFLPCDSEAEAIRMLALLNSRPALEFLDSLIFWDAKRPITADILRRLNLKKLAQLLSSDAKKEYEKGPSQSRLFHEAK